MNTIIKSILQKLSRIIYYLTPYELKENTIIRPSGVLKLLTDEKDKQTFEILSEEIKKVSNLMIYGK
tara:strand:- start:262 stop:462 length:201 start_codon:yes stop_codon:yes gene_type:complete